mmetsp:Transcript_31186/g.99066  ORF Transcript_31186/g.99066 Transcript_31186/m.99066 type:complete len:336 (-) Transcript_31186:176-1183(-)
MFFRDIGAGVAKFLSDPYVLKKAVNVQAPSTDSFGWKVRCEEGLDAEDASAASAGGGPGAAGPNAAPSGKLGPISAKLAATLSDQNYFRGLSAVTGGGDEGVAVGVDCLEVHTDGRIRVDATLRSSAARRFLLQVEDSRHELGKPLQSMGKIGLEYGGPAYAGVLDLDVVNGPTFGVDVCVGGQPAAAAAVAGPRFFAGGAATLNTQLDLAGSPTFSAFGFGGGCLGDGWSAAALTLENCQKVRIAAEKSNAGYRAGVTADWGFTTQTQHITLGLSSRLDDKTTAYARVQSKGTIAGALRQTVSEHVTLTLAGEVNVSKIAQDQHRWGAEVDLKL